MKIEEALIYDQSRVPKVSRKILHSTICNFEVIYT